MELREYQLAARETSIDIKTAGEIAVLGLGIAGEAGEVADHIKKLIRDDDSVIFLDRKHDVEEELGDLLWYLSQVALYFDLNLDEIATKNLSKLRTRREG